MLALYAGFGLAWGWAGPRNACLQLPLQNRQAGQQEGRDSRTARQQDSRQAGSRMHWV
jgi:hypothetical protein